MKQAILTVASKNTIHNARVLMQSAHAHYPAWVRLVYVLDGEKPFEEEGVQYIPAKELYPGKSFERVAFSYPEAYFEKAVAVKALVALCPCYTSVVLAEWGCVLKSQAELLDQQLPADSVGYLVDTSTRLEPKLDNSFMYNGKDRFHFESPLMLFSHGTHVMDYLRFCDAKFDDLLLLGVTSANLWGYEEFDVLGRVVFYDTWQDYTQSFAIERTVSCVENLFMRRTKGVDLLPVQNFTPLLRFEQKVKRNIAILKRYPDGLGRADEGSFLNTKLLEEYSKPALQALAEYKKTVAMLGEAPAYTYASFANGWPVLDLVRAYYSLEKVFADKAGNDPFGAPAVFLEENCVLGDTNLLLLSAPMLAIWKLREDIQNVYPDPVTKDRLGYMHWYLENAAKEYDLPAAYLAPVEASLTAYRARVAAVASGRGFAQKVRDKLTALRGGQVVHTAENYPAPSLEPGVNLCGFIRGDFGVAEASRILAASLEAAGVPFTIVDFMPQENFEHTFTNHSWDHKITNEFKYNTNILLTNAPGTKTFAEGVAPEALKDRYNIGFWYWELPEFPDHWLHNLDYVDELWTSSEFTAESFRTVTDKPVHVVPCCVRVGDIAPLGRKEFGLDEDAFVFLMMYDALSFNDRKNPEGILEAFLSKFAGNDKVQLAIKISAPPSWSFDDDFSKKAKQQPNVVMLTGTYPRAKVNALLACCDAFVSLHRSEGFGLGPAEAMYLGKPAVLTNWSGNTQYMNETNCCPVGYTIVEIEENFGEYRRGRHWADPDVAEAAAYMQRLVEDRVYYERIAMEGQRTIRENFDAKSTGELAKKRLAQLGKI